MGWGLRSGMGARLQLGPPWVGGEAPQLQGRPLEDLGWGKEEKTIELDDVGCAGCEDSQE